MSLSEHPNIVLDRQVDLIKQLVEHLKTHDQWVLFINIALPVLTQRKDSLSELILQEAQLRDVTAASLLDELKLAELSPELDFDK